MKSSQLSPEILVPNIIFNLTILVFLTSDVYCQTDSITDRQGNIYKTVMIGEQLWMAENLRTTMYANGEEIPHITNDTDWANTNAGAYCYYDNTEVNIKLYGNLYNWYTIHDERGVCPEGWHVPSDQEWMTLEKYLGMSSSEAGRMTAWRGTNEGDKLKHPDFGGNNSSGFSALGTGYRDPLGVYKAQGTDNDYWTSTAFSGDNNLEGILHGLLSTKTTVVRNFHDPAYGFCARCIKDNITKVSDPLEIENTLVFPNPAMGQLNLQNACNGALTIMNIEGITMLKGVISGSIQQIDISGLEPGAYVLSITGGKDMYTGKFIKE